MKKTILGCLFILLSGVSYAQNDFYPAVIITQKNAQIECLVEIPDRPDVKAINTKMNKDSKTEKIACDSLTKIRLFLNKDREMELERLPVISINNVWRGKQKFSNTGWLVVIERGPVTLYGTMVKSYMGTFNTAAGLANYAKTTDMSLFCKRANEEGASMMVFEVSGSIQIGNPFPKMASNYFVDAPDIAEKIKNKEKGYTAKDLLGIVQEYNAEKLLQGKE